MKRLLITFALLAVFRILAVLPLPGVDTKYLESIGGRTDRINVMGLGLQPLAGAFVIVELWSFVFARGLELRRGGAAGRRKLNTFALRVGIVLALLQAGGIGVALQRQSTPDGLGLSLVRNPGISFLLVTAMTLVAGTALAFLLANAISRWGMCNGFCLIVLLPVVWSAAIRVHDVAVSSDSIFLSGIEPLVWIAALGLVLKMFLHRPEVVVSSDQREGVSVTLPAFPQGIVPIVWTYTVFSFVSTLSLVFRADSSTAAQQFQSPIAVLIMVILIMAFSFGAFTLFSSGRRLNSSLPFGTQTQGSQSAAGRWLLSTTALLVVFGTVFYGNRSFFRFQFTEILGFPALVLLVAFVFDLVAETRFRLRYLQKVEPVIEMDNVYGACYLRAVLTRQGIDSVMRAFQYRSLFFFLAPIVKMEVLVPTVELTRAQKIIRTSGLEIV